MIETKRYQAAREATEIADRLLTDFRAGLSQARLERGDAPMHHAKMALSGLHLCGVIPEVRVGMGRYFESFSRGLLYLEAEQSRWVRVSANACGLAEVDKPPVTKAYLLARLGERGLVRNLILGDERWSLEQRAFVLAAMGKPEWAAQEMHHELPDAPVTVLALEEMVIGFIKQEEYAEASRWMAAYRERVSDNDYAALLFVIDAYIPGGALERGLEAAEDLDDLRFHLSQAYLNKGKIGSALEQAYLCRDDFMTVRCLGAMKRWGRAQRELAQEGRHGRPRITYRAFF